MTEESKEKHGVLGRSITGIEFVNIQKMFCEEHGYKDLIRLFQKEFEVTLPKKKAKEFIKNRRWYDVFMWLTGEEIEPPDVNTLIPNYSMKQYAMLDLMLKYDKEDKRVREQDIEEFESGDYYIDENVKYFNFPLYGEIITYKFKDPILKCFLLNSKTHKIDKIEDVPVSDKLPNFLLRIIRKINFSVIRSCRKYEEVLNDQRMQPILSSVRVSPEDDETLKNKVDITTSPLFAKYNFQVKT
jgi:hypothetical protein